MRLIEVNNLSKEFRLTKRRPGLIGSFKDLLKKNTENKTVVKNLSFSIDKGECVAYVGPNGAGKSTTIKMLIGILNPTNGSIKINGFVPYEERKDYVKNIGVVFGNRKILWDDLSAYQGYKLLQNIYEIENDKFQEQLDYLVKVLDVKDLLHRPTRELSLGQRLRVEFIGAFIHSPKVVFLDEPTLGLDFDTKERIRYFIKEIISKKKVTIIYTSHDLKEIEEVCNRVIIINKGLKLYDGNFKSLRSEYSLDKKIIISSPKITKETSIKNLEKTFNIEQVKASKGKLEFYYNSKEINIQELLFDLGRIEMINDISINDVEIESIIRSIYENKK